MEEPTSPQSQDTQGPKTEVTPNKYVTPVKQRSWKWSIFPALLIAVFVIIGVTSHVFSSASSATVVKTGLLSLGLENSGGHTMCLDDLNRSTTNGTRMVIWTCNTADPAQKFSRYSDNTIRIYGKCVDVYQASKSPGAEIDLYTCNGGANQVWTTGTNAKVSLNDLVSKQSGYCLDDLSSKTANASVTDLYPCNGTGAQVWGWNTGSSVVAGGDAANNNCNAIGGFGEPNNCYIQIGAMQKNIANATGVSANFSQNAPYCGPNCIHSVVEFQVGSADEKNLIEFGWGVQANQPKGTAPISTIGLYANGSAVDADANFVQLSKTIKIGQAVPTNGTLANFKIAYVASSQQWQLLYNNTEIGYFPESIWTSRKTSLTSLPLVFIFGEDVYSPAMLNSNMQMGNGILGSKSGSASVTGYTLYGTTTAPNLSPFAGSKDTANYNDGNITATSFTYGGPGVDQ